MIDMVDMINTVMKMNSTIKTTSKMERNSKWMLPQQVQCINRCVNAETESWKDLKILRNRETEGARLRDRDRQTEIQKNVEIQIQREIERWKQRQIYKEGWKKCCTAEVGAEGGAEGVQAVGSSLSIF